MSRLPSDSSLRVFRGLSTLDYQRDISAMRLIRSSDPSTDFVSTLHHDKKYVNNNYDKILILSDRTYNTGIYFKNVRFSLFMSQIMDSIVYYILNIY